AKIHRLQWKVNPAPSQADAPVTRPIEQIVAQQRAYVAHHRRIARRVESMAPIVDALARNLETASIPAHGTVALQERDAGQIAASELESGAESGRTTAQNHDVRLG